MAVHHQLHGLLGEACICVSTHEATVSPEWPLQHLHLFLRESPQADLRRAHPEEVGRLAVPDPDLQSKFRRPGIEDLWDVVVLLPGERVQSSFVDGLAQELGILLCKSRSVQADQHHSLAALHRHSVGEPGASCRLLVGWSEARHRCGVPRPLAPRGGGPRDGSGLAARLTASPRHPWPRVLLWRRRLPVAPAAAGCRGADV